MTAEWNSQRYARAQETFKQGKERVETSPPPDGQKFAPGTFVWIDKNLGPSMSDFKCGCPARVEYTYSHAYPSEAGFGSKNIDSYSLLIRYDESAWRSRSWYYEKQLTEIKDQKLIEQYLAEIASPLMTDKETK